MIAGNFASFPARRAAISKIEQCASKLKFECQSGFYFTEEHPKYCSLQATMTVAVFVQLAACLACAMAAQQYDRYEPSAWEAAWLAAQRSGAWRNAECKVLAEADQLARAARLLVDVARRMRAPPSSPGAALGPRCV